MGRLSSAEIFYAAAEVSEKGEALAPPFAQSGMLSIENPEPVA
jgi:hypothetical protein